jgi:phospholipid-binding lipoprotein MlaA
VSPRGATDQPRPPEHVPSAVPMPPHRRGNRLALALLTTVLVTGCASLPADATRSPKDPWEGFNRGMFAFNEALDSAFVKPVAEGYQRVVPTPVRDGVDNFLGNLGDAWSTLHLFLQAKPQRGLDMGLRTATNTVLGLGGVLDVATAVGLERISTEDTGQTLGRWGVKSGPYLVLPLFGPSSVRDALARPLDMAAGPSLLFEHKADRGPATALSVLHVRSRLLDASRVLDEIALDKYVLVRDGYLQRRRNLVYDGDPPDED